jgi:hypothetical protein
MRQPWRSLNDAVAESVDPQQAGGKRPVRHALVQDGDP